MVVDLWLDVGHPVVLGVDLHELLLWLELELQQQHSWTGVGVFNSCGWGCRIIDCLWMGLLIPVGAVSLLPLQ